MPNIRSTQTDSLCKAARKRIDIAKLREEEAIHQALAGGLEVDRTKGIGDALKVIQDEFIQDGVLEPDLSRFMAEQVKSATNSAQLSDHQINLIETQLMQLRLQIVLPHVYQLPPAMERKALWLRIRAKVKQGNKINFLQEGFNEMAKLFVKYDLLTESAVQASIPGLVLDGAVQAQLLDSPQFRIVQRTVVGNLLEGWMRKHPNYKVPIPDHELTEAIGDEFIGRYAVTKEYVAWFSKIISPCTDAWIAEVLTHDVTVAMTALELPKPKKRGAPVILPPERKEAAIELKTSGGSNSEAAALIYNTKFPTPQQTKNVPAILRQYKKANKNRG